MTRDFYQSKFAVDDLSDVVITRHKKTKAAGAQSRTAFEADYYNADDHTLFLETVKPSRLIRHTKHSWSKEVRHG